MAQGLLNLILLHVCCNCAQFEHLLGHETGGFLFAYLGALQNTHGEYTNYKLGMYEPGPGELATCAEFS
jgi:hypothetical protein